MRPWPESRARHRTGPNYAVGSSSIAQRMEPGRVYQVDLVGPDGTVEDVGFIAPECYVPPSVYGHAVDGSFSTGGEWSDVRPTKGRYAYLYADFDGSCLHLMNDWHLARNQVSDADFNKFLISMWSSEDGTRRLDWLIRVYASGKVGVDLNGLEIPDLVTGRYGHGRSPMVQDALHSLYELSVDVVGGCYRLGWAPPETAWYWSMEWLDPMVASPSAGVAALEVPYQPSNTANPPSTSWHPGLVREPVQVTGLLCPAGGMTIAAHWRPPAPPPGIGCGMTVDCDGATALPRLIGAEGLGVSHTCRISEFQVPWTKDTALSKDDCSSDIEHVDSDAGDWNERTKWGRQQPDAEWFTRTGDQGGADADELHMGL